MRRKTKTVMEQMNAEKPDNVLADLEAKHGSQQRLVRHHVNNTIHYKMNELKQAIERVEAGHYAPQDILDVCKAAKQAACKQAKMRPLTNREVHEEAAGMGLSAEFFIKNNIDPDAPFLPKRKLWWDLYD